MHHEHLIMKSLFGTAPSQLNSFSSTKLGVQLDGALSQNVLLQTQLLELYLGVKAVPNRPYKRLAWLFWRTSASHLPGIKSGAYS